MNKLHTSIRRWIRCNLNICAVFFFLSFFPLQSGNSFTNRKVAWLQRIPAYRWQDFHLSVTGRGACSHLVAGEKMPAILVASNMKSGLPKPKPVHSALPIPQTPSRTSPLALPPAPLKTHIPSLGQQVGSRPPRNNAAESEVGRNTQVRM